MYLNTTPSRTYSCLPIPGTVFSTVFLTSFPDAIFLKENRISARCSTHNTTAEDGILKGILLRRNDRLPHCIHSSHLSEAFCASTRPT